MTFAGSPASLSERSAVMSSGSAVEAQSIALQETIPLAKRVYLVGRRAAAELDGTVESWRKEEHTIGMFAYSHRSDCHVIARQPMTQTSFSTSPILLSIIHSHTHWPSTPALSPSQTI